MNTSTKSKYITKKNKVPHRTLIFAVLFSLILLKNNISEAATRNYIGATGGLWSTGSNWSPSGAPVSGDVVTISNGASVILSSNINFTSGSISISNSSSLNTNNTGMAETITIGGTASFSIASGASSTPNHFVQSGGTVTINGELMPTNSLTLSGGTLTNNGSSIVTGTNLVLSGGTFNNNGAVDVGGQFQLTGATVNNASTGVITAMVSNNIMSSGIVNNNGTMDFQSNGGNLSHSGGTINNNSGATMTYYTYSGTGGIFNNNAGSTLNVENQINIGNGTIGVAFKNDGSIVGNTNLNIFGGGSFTSSATINLMGNLNISAGASMNITDGTAHFEKNSTISGTLNMANADLSFAHSLTISPGATLNLLGDYSVSVDVFVVNGTCNANNGSNGPDIIVTGNVNGTGTIQPTGTYSATISYPNNVFTGALWGTDDHVGTMTLGPVLLPVELFAFNGYKHDESVILKWSTATEMNNDYFIIEKSSDSKHFDAIATVDGAGNSSQIINYSFTDENALSQIAYYRIKQTDFNGDFKYSKTIAVMSNDETEIMFSNPSAGEINISFDISKIKTIGVYDLSGNVIHLADYSDRTSTVREMIEINLTVNNSGFYIIKTLDISTQPNSYKMLVQ